MTIRFKRFLSVDSAKAAKATEYGYLNGINYMSPAETVLSNGKLVNLCSHASPGCIALCLGKYSGQASMVKDLENGTNDVRRSRALKAEYFMMERDSFMNEFCLHISNLVASAHKLGLKPCVRPNGSTDIAFEGIRVRMSEATAKHLNKRLGKLGFAFEAKTYANIFDVFPSVQFVDYTKNHYRFNRALPVNYSLTFSRAESNEETAIQLLSRGVNVAVVFADALPQEWHGFTVIDGDKHDLRHLDPKGARGFVVGLLPKGNKAKRDESGFVVRLAA